MKNGEKIQQHRLPLVRILLTLLALSPILCALELPAIVTKLNDSVKGGISVTKESMDFGQKSMPGHQIGG